MNNVRSNRRIDYLILTANWEIELNFGFRSLMQYLSVFDAMEVEKKSVFDLGLSEQRKESKAILCHTPAGTVLKSGTAFDLAEDVPKGSIAHLKLNGVMRAGDGMSSRGIQSLTEDIRAASGSSNIDAIVLEVNSGGGESIAGDLLFSAVSDATKPVITWTHFLASAAIRGTLPSAEVIASSERTEVGSIGTFASIDKRFVEWYKENVDDIYASDSTAKNAWFREYLAGNKAPLQAEIDRSQKLFAKSVKQFRPISGTPQEIKETLSGAVFTARDAKKRGLIDSIGGLNFAIERARSHAKKIK